MIYFSKRHVNAKIAGLSIAQVCPQILTRSLNLDTSCGDRIDKETTRSLGFEASKVALDVRQLGDVPVLYSIHTCTIIYDWQYLRKLRKVERNYRNTMGEDSNEFFSIH